MFSPARGVAAAGQGRLAQVIATRGGRAAPEAPFVIEHREALIYMLCEAAELEHAIMCQYLFARLSGTPLRRSPGRCAVKRPLLLRQYPQLGRALVA